MRVDNRDIHRYIISSSQIENEGPDLLHIHYSTISALLANAAQIAQSLFSSTTPPKRAASAARSRWPGPSRKPIFDQWQ